MNWKDIVGISLLAGILTAITSLFLRMRLEIAGLFIMYWLTVFFADRIKSRRRG